MYDSQKKFYQFIVTPTGKTVNAIVLKSLSGIGGFVNQSNITNFVISETSSYKGVIFNENF